jgi:hypothetical protein
MARRENILTHQNEGSNMSGGQDAIRRANLGAGSENEQANQEVQNMRLLNSTASNTNLGSENVTRLNAQNNEATAPNTNLRTENTNLQNVESAVPNTNAQNFAGLNRQNNQANTQNSRRKRKRVNRNTEITPGQLVKKTISDIVVALNEENIVIEDGEETQEHVNAYVAAVLELIRATPSNKGYLLIPGINKTLRDRDPSASKIRVAQKEEPMDIEQELQAQDDLVVVGQPLEIQDFREESKAYQKLIVMFSSLTKDSLLFAIEEMETTTSNVAIKTFLEQIIGADDKYTAAITLLKNTSKRARIYGIMSTYSSMLFAAKVLVHVIKKEQERGLERGKNIIPIPIMIRMILLGQSVHVGDYGIDTSVNYWRWLFENGLGESNMRLLKTGLSGLMMCGRLGMEALMFPQDVYVMWALNKITADALYRILRYQPCTSSVKDLLSQVVVPLKQFGVVSSLTSALPFYEVEGDILKFIRDLF